MDHHKAGAYWNDNAETWTQLVRAGYDVYRDALNTPAFLAMLPDVRSLSGLDVGCGEGANTRILATRCAALAAIDISETFIRYAKETEWESPLGIDYRNVSALDLPFPDHQFDFATAFMSLMDIPEADLALIEAFRVLKPGGFLQFSITHPCFDPPHRRNLRSNGRTYAIEVGDYFRNIDGEISEWIFGTTPDDLKSQLNPFRIPRFHRTLSDWLNLVINAGFLIERIEEPAPTADALHQFPAIQDAAVVAYFLHVRARKPGRPFNEQRPL